MGAVRIREENGLVRLFRFTEEQQALYKTVSPNFYTKALSSAGMKLCFRTDSKRLLLKVVTEPGSTRSFFSYDVFVNGEAVGYLDNFSDDTLPKEYTKADFQLGEFYETFDLGDGVKTVTVYLPWSVSTAIREISIEDGAFIEPVRHEKKLLIFGDSITQGYDALRPSQRYASVFADNLGAEEINKAMLMIEEGRNVHEAAELIEEDESAKLVVYDKHLKGLYVLQRHYQLQDIRLLAEGVYSAKFISQGQANRLANVVCGLVSELQPSRSGTTPSLPTA